MAKTVVGFFENRAQAEHAVSDLVNEGSPRESISIVTTGELGHDTPAVGPVHGIGSDSEAGRDAVIGGIAGLVVGVVALAIPGIGPLIAAGPLAGALGGLGIGAAAGGLIGKLADHGVSEEEAEYYAEGIRRGGTLVTVQAEDKAAGEVDKVMDRNGAVDVLKRAEEWRAAGWTPAPRVRRAG